MAARPTGEGDLGCFVIPEESHEFHHDRSRIIPAAHHRLALGVGGDHRRGVAASDARLRGHPPPARSVDARGAGVDGVLSGAADHLRHRDLDGLWIGTGHGILHRLPAREIAVGGQSVHLHAAPGGIRGPSTVGPAGVVVRHRGRAGTARHLHRPRRRRARRTGLGIPAVRRDPAVDRREIAERRDHRPGGRGRRLFAAFGATAAPGTARDRWLPRNATERAGGGTARADPIGPGGRRGDDHRSDLCHRLGARGLRRHRRSISGVRHQRLRTARPARTVFRPALGPEPTGAPRLRTRTHPGVHRRETGAALGTRDLGGCAADFHRRLAAGDRRGVGHGHRDEPVGHPQDCYAGAGGPQLR